jgi:hypothetical protein
MVNERLTITLIIANENGKISHTTIKAVCRKVKGVICELDGMTHNVSCAA